MDCTLGSAFLLGVALKIICGFWWFVVKYLKGLRELYTIYKYKYTVVPVKIRTITLFPRDLQYTYTRVLYSKYEFL